MQIGIFWSARYAPAACFLVLSLLFSFFLSFSLLFGFCPASMCIHAFHVETFVEPLQIIRAKMLSEGMGS